MAAITGALLMVSVGFEERTDQNIGIDYDIFHRILLALLTNLVYCRNVVWPNFANFLG